MKILIELSFEHDPHSDFMNSNDRECFEIELESFCENTKFFSPIIQDISYFDDEDQKDIKNSLDVLKKTLTKKKNN